MTTLEEKNLNIDNSVAKIKVLGVGGGGSNAVKRMYKNKIEQVEYMVFNTDAQALEMSGIGTAIKIGEKTSRGLGVGGDPSKGRESAEESRGIVRELVDDADLVFISAGMGGGTGTGAAPVIAEVAKESGALTIGVVTKPFGFEGIKRQKQAIEGINTLRSYCDALVVIPNDRLMLMADDSLTMESGFKLADDVLRQGVQSIAEVIVVPGEINLDFSDVKTVMKNAGAAWMGIGEASGENRAVEAAKKAIQSPLLETSIEQSRGVIFNITGGESLTMHEVQKASDVIAEQVHPEANIIFGTVTDLSLKDEVKLTVIATGFPESDFMYGEGSRALNNTNRTIPSAPEQLDFDRDLDVPPFLRNSTK
ncbi:MAG: cell division protein FtsZ [Chloroflexota bacterium]|tara:strand:- start:245 stop:1339 length:1095 start_codon:yes stop_codon:yes gene_type:complete